MNSRAVLSLAVLLACSFLPANAGPATADDAGEYSKHFDALTKLSTSVAQAMHSYQFAFRPYPESMTFVQLISHIATTNYQFCAGLKDAEPLALPSPTDKDLV